jgi:hypothetical protein
MFLRARKAVFGYSLIVVKIYEYNSQYLLLDYEYNIIAKAYGNIKLEIIDRFTYSLHNLECKLRDSEENKLTFVFADTAKKDFKKIVENELIKYDYMKYDSLIDTSDGNYGINYKGYVPNPMIYKIPKKITTLYEIMPVNKKISFLALYYKLKDYLVEDITILIIRLTFEILRIDKTTYINCLGDI